MIPGEIISNNKLITLNPNKIPTTIVIANIGDRPIQVGSHFHFFEVNKALKFNREDAFGKRLNIPSGTAVRFEPGEEKTVTLISFGGAKRVIGFNNLVDDVANTDTLKTALTKAHQKGFLNEF